MMWEAEAVYENGVLKLDEPLPFQEHERVKITVRPQVESKGLTYGLIGWTGDPVTVKQIALEPEFGVTESP